MYFNNTYTVAFHQVVSLNFCAVSKAIMPGKTVPECVRKLILQKTREKYSQRQISKMLLVPQATISNIISHYRKVGTLSPLRRPGRTPKTSQKSRSFLVSLARICPKLTSKQLQRDWTDGHKVHHSTVRRILIKHGLNGRKAARKPLTQISRKSKI